MRVLAAGLLGLLALGVAGLRASSLPPGERAAFAAVLAVGVLGLSGLTALDLWVVHRRRRLPSKVISLQASGSADDGIAMFYSSRFCRLLRALLLATVCVVATLRVP